MTLAKKYATFFSLRSLFFQELAKCETLVYYSQKNNNKLDYFQQKFINIRLFEIVCNDSFKNDVFRIIILLESIAEIKINEELYETTDIKTFFNGINFDILFAKDFRIIEYRKLTFKNYITHHSDRIFSDIYKKKYWYLPIYDFDLVNLNFSTVTDKFIYMIVPEGFFLSYRPSINELNKYTTQYLRKDEMPDSFVVYKGSYQQCYNVLHNAAELEKYICFVENIRKETEKKVREERDRILFLEELHTDYRELAFDALTDGMYGSYEDNFPRADRGW